MSLRDPTRLAPSPSREAWFALGSPERTVRIPVAGKTLLADLVLPARDGRMVIFAHGSGSGRHSPRNREVGRRLRALGLGTLLLDLLDSQEAQVDEATHELRFNIPLLTERLIAAVDWWTSHFGPAEGSLGLFGASTGGAVALLTAVERPTAVGAVVLRGARSDMAGASAARVRCPTLFLVGEHDESIHDVNERTRSLLTGEHRLIVVPGAGHLFEEPGALEVVARETTEWFDRHLARANAPSSPPPAAPG